MTARRERPMALVVDDDPVVRTIGVEALSAIGFETQEVETGEAALQTCSENEPDLILLDVQLPGRDGFETCRALRQRPALEEVPILIMTGRTDSTTIEQAFDVGATDFIEKPLDWQLVQHRVRFLMRANSAFNDLRLTLSHLEESRRRLESAHELGHLGTWELSPESGEMVWSEELRQLLAPVQDASRTLSWTDFLHFVHDEDRHELEKALRSVIESAERRFVEYRLVGANGALLAASGTLESAEALPGEMVIRGALQDVTQRRQAEAQVAFLEMFDELTQLPNRAHLNDRLERLVARADRHNSSLAVLCVDIDRFQRVNQALGHALGDELLRAIGERLLESVQGSDPGETGTDQPEVSRFGGDEFVIVLGGSPIAAAARMTSSRIVQALSHPFAVGGHSIRVSASIGVSFYPDNASDAGALISNAASAMNRAKRAGGGSFHFFESDTNEDAARQLTLESELIAGIPAGELTLEYQPQCDATSGKMLAAEALVRWNHPRLGRLMPGDFIPAAEDCGLISLLGERVLRDGCEQLRVWDEQGLPPFRLSVNISSLQFNHGNAAEMVQRTLQETGVDPSRLELEITETALLGNEEHVLQTCQNLRAMGVALALDDFGTGFSSLSHLTRFQIDTLKIDRSFVSAIRPGDKACSIVSVVIAMARRLGITVVAEGVELVEQEAFLRNEGCDLLQGYGICRPVPPDKLESWLRARLEARG